MGTNADAAVGMVVTSFSSIDAATDARLEAQGSDGGNSQKKSSSSSSTVVLADLLLTLSEQARDIAARVPPTSRKGSTRNTRGGGSAEPQASSLQMRIPAPSMQSTDEPEACVPQRKREDESASARTPCSTGEAEEAAMAMSNLNRATDAAEALLVLTASPALRSAFASRDDDDGRGSRVNNSDVSGGSNCSGKPKKKKNTRGNRNQPNGAGVVLDRDTVESLHFAFVMVSSWLQPSIRRAAAATAATNSPTQQQAVVDEAIVHAIELAVRSADLALPLTAPLYQSLASDVIAPHASPASHPSLQIMEVANLLRVSLFPAFNPPPVSFFHGPCVTLVRRGMVREAIELLDEMDAEFGIGEVEAMTGLEMLSAVAEGMGLVNDDSGGGGGGGESGGKAGIVFGKVGRSRGGAVQGGAGNLAMELDPVDATELVFRLRRPLLRQLDEVSKELRREMDSAAEGAEANAELVDLLESLSRPAADIDNDGDNSTGNNEDDGDNDDVLEEALLEEYLEAADDSSAADDKANTLADIESLSSAVSSLAEDGSGPSPASAVGRSRGSDASTSTVYSTYQIPQSLHNQMASEMIYVRKGPSWDLPDLVEQPKRFNDGKDILYTRQYEEEMISAMMRDWEGDEDDLDDLDGYDDDGEERER